MSTGSIGRSLETGRRLVFSFNGSQGIVAAGKTSFSGSDLRGIPLSYVQGFVNVSVDGYTLDEDEIEYPATGVIRVAGTVPTTARVRIETFGPWSPADALARSANGADVLDKAAFRTNLGIVSSSWTPVTTINILSPVALIDVAFPAGARFMRLTGGWKQAGTAHLGVRLSADGVTFPSAANSYDTGWFVQYGTQVAGQQRTGRAQMLISYGANLVMWPKFNCLIHRGEVGIVPSLMSQADSHDGTNLMSFLFHGYYGGSATEHSHIRILPEAGSIERMRAVVEAM